MGAGAGTGVIGYFHFFRGGESNSFQGKRRRDQSSLTEHIKNWLPMRGSSECYRGSWGGGGGNSGKCYYDTSKILRLPPPLPPLMINNGRSLLSRENNIKFYLSHFWAGRQNFRIVWLPFKYTFCFRFVLKENDKERKKCQVQFKYWQMKSCHLTVPAKHIKWLMPACARNVEAQVCC